MLKTFTINLNAMVSQFWRLNPPRKYTRILKLLTALVIAVCVFELSWFFIPDRTMMAAFHLVWVLFVAWGIWSKNPDLFIRATPGWTWRGYYDAILPRRHLFSRYEFDSQLDFELGKECLVALLYCLVTIFTVLHTENQFFPLNILGIVAVVLSLRMLDMALHRVFVIAVFWKTDFDYVNIYHPIMGMLTAGVMVSYFLIVFLLAMRF